MNICSVKWLYVLEKDCEVDIVLPLPENFPNGCAFEDRDGNRWLEINAEGKPKILKKYAWDGCTPKFAIWDIVIGTPDGIPHEQTLRPKAYFASLVHDVLYQFLDAGLPIKRRVADQHFLHFLKQDQFAPRWVYYVAVRMFGWLFRLFTRWKREYKGSKVVPI
jgi:hypothetical protein